MVRRCLLLLLALLFARPALAGPVLNLSARKVVKSGNGFWTPQFSLLKWEAQKTAIVICDMWDDHYCRKSAQRVAEMAPRMNEVIEKARAQGVLIIHCPSGCMNVYKGTPQRRMAQSAPKVKTKIPLKGWCHLDPKQEAPLPVQDDMPCDDEKPRERKRFYNRQIKTLDIKEGDAITDSAEAYYLMRQRGIRNVIIMGVHTNMCVLGRPFGIRQMVYQGQNVVLMRDMTDSMYSPQQKPYVSHFRGNELIIEHVERHWCPTITSTAFTGKAAFRFEEDRRPHVVFVAGGGEYDAHETLPPFANELQKHGFSTEVLIGRGKKETYEIPGLEAVKKADLLVLFLRRRALRTEQLDLIRNYLKAGKPLVALRTASHGFEAGKPPAGRAVWNGFDKEVLGCDYRGHGPNKPGSEIKVVPMDSIHPILQGVKPLEWHSQGSLYNSEPLAKGTTLLLTGTVKGKTGAQPVAWTYRYKGGKVFYSSLGHKADFSQPGFRRLLINAIHWAVDKPVEKPKKTGAGSGC